MTDIEALKIAIGHTGQAISYSDGAGPETEAVTVLRAMLARLEECAARGARPYTCKIVGLSHSRPYEEEYQCLDEAICAAYYVREDARLKPQRVINMDGATILSEIEFNEALDQYGALIHAASSS